MENAYLAANLRNIEKLDKHLIELELLGSYEQEVPIGNIRMTLRGMKHEIARLQGMVTELSKALKETQQPKEK